MILPFRQLRGKCTSLIKKAKSESYLSVTTENLNNPQTFWKVIKSISVSKSPQALPTFVLKDLVPVYDRTEVLNCFNNHFLSSGSLFDPTGAAPVSPCTETPRFSGEPFNFLPFTVQQVHQALKTLDSRKSPGPDSIEPYFLKIAASFNLSIENKEILFGSQLFGSQLLLPPY